MLSFSKKSLWLDSLACLIVIFAVLACKGWVVSAGNMFIMDDYSTLLRASSLNPVDYFRIIPKSIYNDRPVGDFFYYFVAHQLHLQYMIAHAFQLLMHLYNGILAYYIFRRLGIERWSALFGVIIFAVYPASSMAVQWTSAIYDLLSMVFAMSAFALYVYHLHDDKRVKYIISVMILILYILAVRTKEMAILLPFLLALIALYDAIQRRCFQHLRENLIALLPSFIYLIIIALVYLDLYFVKNNVTIINPESPYFISLSPISMVAKLWGYLSLYFDSHTFALIIFCCLCMIFIRTVKLLVIVAMIVSVMMAVLPMKNNLHQLYLYIPSFFIAFLFANLMDSIFKYVKKEAVRFGIVTLLMVLLYADCQILDAKHFNRGPWLALAARQGEQHRQFQKNVKFLNGNEKILVHNVTGGNNIFGFYGPGNSIRLYSGNPGLKMDLLKEKASESVKKNGYDIIIDYNNGNFIFEKMSQSKKPVQYAVRI